VESTRDQILRQIRGHREMTVAQLAESLKLSAQAVRRHLDGLRADALIDVRQERHGVGRPSLVFFVTERGEELGGRTYVQLLSRMFRHLEKLDVGKVSGASGKQVVEQVFSGIAEEVAADHRSEVRGETLDQRVEEASRALNREGIVDGWEKDGESFHLINGDCPYLKLAEMSDAACSADRHSIELLVGAEVEQTRRIVDGAPCCEYIVKPQPVTLLDDEIKEQG
jgi:DeoR family transcriptional regulator, suf operon transcriptional repressor